QGDIAFLEEWDERWVVAGGAQRRLDARAMAAQQQRVTRSDLDAGLFLPVFHVLPAHPDSRQIEQHATRDDPFPRAVDGQLRAASPRGDDLFEVQAVVQLAVVRHMTERVEV